MKPKSVASWVSLFLVSVAACREVELPPEAGVPGFEPVVRAAKAPPIMGGTMLVTQDGAYAVISDPPRDMIHIVDLERWEETGTIVLDDGALPFRGVEGVGGQVHITLRGPGSLITIDPASATITQTTSVCPNPRGVAFDVDTGARHVACAGGLLLTLPASGDPPTRRFIAPDLRDVFVSQGRLFVSRFRSAQLLEVEDDGSWSLFGEPVSIVTPGDTSRDPTTAWRTLPIPTGGWLMLHQAASTDPVPGFDEPSEDPIFDGGGYAGSGSSCSEVVNPTLSLAYNDGVVRNSGPLHGFALGVDAALSPDGFYVAVAVPSQQDSSDPEEKEISVFERRLSMFPTSTDQDCKRPDPLDVDDDIVAVAYQPNGALLAQANDEPILYRLNRLSGEEARLVLSGSSAEDTGFALFHNDAGGGVACASCHPEGGEDGRTWVFADLGPRRTQALDVGLRDTEPFHWKGDMDDIHMIARQVRQGAMGGIEQSEARQEALAEWLFSLRTPNPVREQPDAEAAEGEQLFGALGCASCHAGPSFTSPASADLGHGPLQTPALRGVALRPPYMHDGRSATLEDAVLDMARSTAPNTALDAGEVASLVAYLESL